MHVSWFRWLVPFALLFLPSVVLATVELEDCADRFGETARCTWIEVPEDRSTVGGRTLRLRVVVLPSSKAEPLEPLVLFPGGPGQATPSLIPLARQAYPSVRELRDVVFVGQRGSGESNAMNCLEEIASKPGLLFGALWNRDAMKECAERTRAFAAPDHYLTGDYVADVLDVLDRLGYGKIVVWGGSGGTRIAQALIRQAPDRVVAAALDGVTPIDYAMPLPFSRFAQRAWDRVVADCAAQTDCAAAFPNLDADLQRLFERVETSPQPVRITSKDGARTTVKMARGDLAYALRGLLYNANAIRTLPASVHAAAESGDLSFFAQSLYDRAAGLLGGGVVAVGLHITQYCAEDVPRIDEGVLEEETAGTFLGRYLVDEYRGACAQWPVEPARAEWYRDFRAQVPTLFVSGWYDPSTPDVVAERVRRSLPNSRHIVVRNLSHGAGFTCARPIVEEFLRSGSLGGVDDPCPNEPVRFDVSP